MGVRIDGRYEGRTQVSLTHEEGQEIRTCAPKDNGGDGSLFSPTDLVAAATGACILTIMAQIAEREGMSFEGASFSAEKIMAEPPRRIGTIRLAIAVPGDVSETLRRKLEKAAEICPVKRSLNPEIALDVSYLWGSKPKQRS